MCTHTQRTVVLWHPSHSCLHVLTSAGSVPALPVVSHSHIHSPTTVSWCPWCLPHAAHTYSQPGMCSYTSVSQVPCCLLPAHVSASSQTHSSTLPGPACTHKYPAAFLSPSHMCVGSLRILLGASLIHTLTHSKFAVALHTRTLTHQGVFHSLLLVQADSMEFAVSLLPTQRFIHHLSTIKPSFPVSTLTSRPWLFETCAHIAKEQLPVAFMSLAFLCTHSTGSPCARHMWTE